MNQNIPPRKTLLTAEEQNPWEDRENLPVMTPYVTLLYCLAILVCSLYPLLPLLLPVASQTFSALTFGVIAVCALCILLSARRPFLPLLATALFFAGCFAGLTVLGTDYAAMVGTEALCLLVVVGAGGFTLLMNRSYLLLCAVPAVALLVGYLLTRQAAPALAVLLPYPAAGALGYCLLRNRSRVGTICVVSGLLLFGLLTAALLLLYMQTGVLSGTLLLDRLNEWKAQTLQAVADIAAQQTGLSAYFQEQGLDYAAAMEQVVLLLFNLLPAFTVLAVTALAYLSQLFCVHTLGAFGLRRFVTVRSVIFSLSLPSGLLYLFTATVSLFASADSMFGAVCLNLQLILFPGMCIVGFYRLVSSLRQKKGPVLPVLLILALLLMPQLFLLLLSISGAFATLMHRLLLRRLSASGNFPPDDSNPSGDGQNPSGGQDGQP